MKNFSFQKHFTAVIYFTAVFLLFAQTVAACSWDYSIWQIRSKNADPLYRFLRNGKAGYIDQTGKIVVEPNIESYGGNYGDEFYDGLLLTGISAGAYIDKTGKIALDTKYSRNWDFSDGLAVAMREDNGKWGYIDRTGKFVISPRFESYPNGYVSSFSDNLAAIDVKGKYGYIDRTGEFVVQPKFLQATDFAEGLARVVVEGPCVYVGDDPCAEFNATVIPKGVKDENASLCKFAFIDKSGAIISDERFERALNFSEGFAPVMRNGKWGYIDKTGQMVIEPEFDDAGTFSDGLALVRQKKLWGFINKQGKFVIPPQFENADNFADGLAPVGKWYENREQGDYYYINKQGKQAFPGRFAIASHFFKGLAHVMLIDENRKKDEYYKNGKYAYIDVKGKIVFTYERKSEDD